MSKYYKAFTEVVYSPGNFGPKIQGADVAIVQGHICQPGYEMGDLSSGRLRALDAIEVALLAEKKELVIGLCRHTFVEIGAVKQSPQKDEPNE